MRFALQAEVRHGRLILDEPVDLPEGTKVELIPADDGDDLDEDERERLHAALRRSAEQLARGEGSPPKMRSAGYMSREALIRSSSL